jgi:hypothetical protein
VEVYHHSLIDVRPQGTGLNKGERQIHLYNKYIYMYTLRIIHVFGDHNETVIYSNPIGDKVMVTFQKTRKIKKSITYHRSFSNPGPAGHRYSKKKAKAVFTLLSLRVFGRLK